MLMEGPILMSESMALAVIEERKTQTRRIPTKLYDGTWHFNVDEASNKSVLLQLCPYGVAGDTLWVRENWRTEKRYDALPPRELPRSAVVQYRAGMDTTCQSPREPKGRWRVGMHMPRWACRSLLRITNIRVQRLQSITETDCRREGCPDEYFIHPYDWFTELWDDINAKRGFPWASNPWVYAITFELT